jgi:hypothetical protein
MNLLNLIKVYPILMSKETKWKNQNEFELL